MAKACLLDLRVIMDNVKFHKYPRIREIIEYAGCQLLYLPPHSPDLNPIEHHWAWLQK
jgi:transposase